MKRERAKPMIIFSDLTVVFAAVTAIVAILTLMA